jgi:magnesium transporter
MPILDSKPTAELLLLLAHDPDDLAEAVAGLQPVDLAAPLRELPPEQAARIISQLPADLAIALLDEPELGHQRLELLRHLDDAKAAKFFTGLAADQQADLLGEASDEDRERLLRLADQPTRDNVALLLRYPPHTAGGIMTTEFVSMPATWTAEQALAHIKAVGEAKETVYAVYVLSPADQTLEHVVSLRELLTVDGARPVGEIGDPRPPLTVAPETDREDVARLISRYDLLAVPVIDSHRKVLGIVTVDDVIDALVSEQTEDVQKFGGMEALDEPYQEIGFLDMVKKRAGWLTVLFLSEMLTATAMGRFEHEIERAVVLALFIPLIISSGGNSGSQATSLIIRAMALKEVTLKDWWRVAFRELPAGLALGAILGSIGVLRILVWQGLGWYDYGVHFLLVAFTVGIALVGVVTFGSMAGSMLPFLLRRLGFDPASASAPFVATLVDVTGLVIYFSVAALMLRGTLL